MSKIILCNNEEIFNKLCDQYCFMSFSQNGLRSDELIHAATFSKLNISTENFCEIGDDFVACSGTIAYRNQVGKKALKTLYENFDIKNINGIRKNTVGSYAVIIKKGNQASLFIDEAGTYGLYYYNKNGLFLTTNTFTHIQCAVKTELCTLALQERLIEYCNLDNATIFQEIYRLLGTEAIVFDYTSRSIETVRIDCNHYSFKINDEKEVVEKLIELLEKYSRSYALFSSKKVLFTTGGVDSRAILAIYNHMGVKPDIANWGGCPIEMNTKSQDQEIARRLAERSGLLFKVFNVSHDFKADYGVIPEKIRKYGELGLLYCGNTKWFEIFEGTPFESFDFGYFGETIKAWEPLDVSYHVGFTIDDYVDLFFNRQRYLKGNTDSLKEYVRKKIYNIAKEYNIELQNLSKEDCMVLYYVYRVHADTACTNFANMFGFSANIFAEKELADYINQIPYVLKENDHLNLMLTEKLDSKLLNIPYFTHCKYRVFNKEKKCLEEPKRIKKDTLTIWLKRQPFWPILKFLRNVFSVEREKRYKVVCELTAGTSFSKKADLIVSRTSFTDDSILFELPGWAQLIHFSNSYEHT